LALYGSWATSFGGNNGITGTGVPQPPQQGKQFEIGAKANVGTNVLATLSLYHLVRNNLLTPDLSTPDPNDSIAIGEARSRGVEFDLTGRLTRGLDIVTSYAFTDAKVRVDNSGLRGKQLSNVPKIAGSVWLRYEFDRRPLMLGAGVFAAGNRQGDPQNTFILEKYARLDLMTAYRWRISASRLVAQFNVRNVLNTTYYESTDPSSNVSPRNGVYPGAPRAFTITFRSEF
jgi:iron complex outermembrane recepter protein